MPQGPAPVAIQASNVFTIDATTHALSPADSGRVLVFTSGSAVTLEVPPGVVNSRFVCGVISLGVGDVTPTAGAGVSILNRQSHTKTAGQYAFISLTGVGFNSLVLAGDTA